MQFRLLGRPDVLRWETSNAVNKRGLSIVRGHDTYSEQVVLLYDV